MNQETIWVEVKGESTPIQATLAQIRLQYRIFSFQVGSQDARRMVGCEMNIVDVEEVMNS